MRSASVVHTHTHIIDLANGNLLNLVCIYIYIYIYTVKSMLKFLYVIQDLVRNKTNSIANCTFYLTKKRDQPEDGS